MGDTKQIVIYRSVDRDGATFALEPESRERVKQKFSGEVHIHPRIFIAHETRSDYASISARIVPQVVQLLTGVAEERLATLGRLRFCDPVTEQDIPLTAV